MSVHPTSPQPPSPSFEAPFYPPDLTLAIQTELSALAVIDCAYEQKRHRFETWSGSQELRTRLVRQAEVRHRHDREPHVLRLGELYERITALALFRDLRTRH